MMLFPLLNCRKIEMKFLYLRFFPVFILSLLLLVACSPHLGSGVWKATANNDRGITKLNVGFDGRAEFTTSKKDNVLWHCFWTTADKKKLALECTPSTNPEKKSSFELSINQQGQAELREKSILLATFNRLNENPSPRE